MKNKAKRINNLFAYLGATGGAHQCALKLGEIMPYEGKIEGENIKKRTR